MTSIKAISFSNSHRDFTNTLNKRVNDYFKTYGISKHANGEMIMKTIVMFTMYFLPYALIVSEAVTSMTGIILLVIIMSFGLAGIGLSVMHDANHGAYSKKKWINTLVGYSLNMVGANSFNWKLQHNVMHHTYTNVHDEDEDISPRGVLRLEPHAPWKRIHKYQFVYAWFLYGLMTLVWLFYKDFYRIVKYHKSGLAKKQNANIVNEWIILIATKLLYIGYIFVIPTVFTALLWWQVLLGIVIMHYIAGFLLAIIFQPAHVIEGTSYPLPDADLTLENNWTVHQLLTTSNFGNKSRWFTWYVGGLNFQIEHHLFPNICHVHYSKVSAIVKETALEFGLPYRSARTFAEALISHARILKQLGQQPA
jgi:linoleoyl-CoA desaturase